MGFLAEIKGAISSQRILNAVQPDLVDDHRVGVLWGNTLRRLRQSVDPRLHPDIRKGARSEVVDLISRAVYNSAELAKQKKRDRIAR